MKKYNSFPLHLPNQKHGILYKVFNIYVQLDKN